MKSITLSRTFTLNILYHVSKKRAILNYSDSYVSKAPNIKFYKVEQRSIVINIFWWPNNIQNQTEISELPIHKNVFFPKKTKENHLKCIQCSMLRPSFYPYRQTWCLNFWTASFKCRPIQTHKRYIIWPSPVFTSFVNNITGKNKLWNTSALSFNFLRFAVQMTK